MPLLGYEVMPCATVSHRAFGIISVIVAVYYVAFKYFNAVSALLAFS